MKMFSVFLALFMLSGCIATRALSQNIDQSELRSKHRLSSEGITTGMCKISAKYLGDHLEYNRLFRVYGFTICDVVLHLKVSDGTSELKHCIITDKMVQLTGTEKLNDLTIYFAKKCPDIVEICSLNGDTPSIYVQLIDQSARMWSKSENKGYNYESARGCAFINNNGQIGMYLFEQDLEVESTTKIGSAVKSIGYLVTLPFDIVTSPIQGVLFLYALGHMYEGVH